MKALDVWTERLLNLKHNIGKFIEAFSKKQCPDSVELVDENGKKYIFKKY